MINSYAPKCLQTNDSFNRPWRNRYNLNTPLRRYRSLSTLVSDYRLCAPKTTVTPGLFTYPPMYTSSAVNQYVTTRQQAADPARRTRLFQRFYPNNKHIVLLARSKTYTQLAARAIFRESLLQSTQRESLTPTLTWVRYRSQQVRYLRTTVYVHRIEGKRPWHCLCRCASKAYKLV